MFSKVRLNMFKLMCFSNGWQPQTIQYSCFAVGKTDRLQQHSHQGQHATRATWPEIPRWSIAFVFFKKRPPKYSERSSEQKHACNIQKKHVYDGPLASGSEVACYASVQLASSVCLYGHLGEVLDLGIPSHQINKKTS